MDLVRHCRAVLAKAEQRIHKLQERDDGGFTKSEFKRPAEAES